jgi:peptide methionine sulfoxide reductase msrA/msrB
MYKINLFQKNIVFLVVVVFVFLSCDNYSQNNGIRKGLPIIQNLVKIDSTWENKIEKSDNYWKKRLTEKQYYILRQKGTERSFTHPLLKNKEAGVYVCAACYNPLYSSKTKFKSGTGWPSFFEPYFSKSINVVLDNTHGMKRNELVCARCESHLGHVFEDGPQPTGERHCINGEALKFVGNSAMDMKAVQTEIDISNTRKAIFAQGCFWCVEEIFEAINGVTDVISGYSGGETKKPTYNQVGAGRTGHAEAVEVTYNPDIVSYEQLLKVYFNSGDISQKNGQGNDKGPQYRSIIFYQNESEKRLITQQITKFEKLNRYSKEIAIEVLPFNIFYKAENYHQDYVKLNPNQGYVKAVSIPRYKRAIKNFPELLKHK